MNGLSCGEESMTKYSAVLIQYQRVTDGQTGGQTDVKPISITCFSIADARKNSQCKYMVTNRTHERLIFNFCAADGTSGACAGHSVDITFT